MNFLKERKMMQNMLSNKDYDTALTFFESNFKSYFATKELSFKKVILCLTILKYLESLFFNDYNKAYEILNKLDNSYWEKNITLTLYDNNNKIIDFSLEVIN